MSELRWNAVCREWVIIATERARRPSDYAGCRKARCPPPERPCPFCPGHEEDHEEVDRLGGAGALWRVRTVRNKFPALSPDAPRDRVDLGLHRSMSGWGLHEVIVEHPRHDAQLATMSDVEVADVLRMYRRRYASVQEAGQASAVVLFKNHGPGAGTSLAHPHSQLVATPVVPPQSRRRVDAAVEHFDATGRCLFCQTLEEELTDGRRVVLRTGRFVSFVPYAALSPFHLWIFPTKHQPSFGDVDEADLDDLSSCLRGTLGCLYRGLQDPDFNYTIVSAPVRERFTEHFHWYLSVVPRVSELAGFELGSGMFINVAVPEESAAFLRAHALGA